MRTLYDVLEIEETATKAQIKAAWRAKAKIHHPDRSSGSEHDKAFKLAKRAFEILHDDRYREQYDEQLASLRRPTCSGCGGAVLAGQTLCPLCALTAASEIYEDAQRSSTHDVDELEREFAWVADPDLYLERTSDYMASGARSADELLRALVAQGEIQAASRQRSGSIFDFELGEDDRQTLEKIVRRLGRATRWMDDLRRWVEGG